MHHFFSIALIGPLPPTLNTRALFCTRSISIQTKDCNEEIFLPVKCQIPIVIYGAGMAGRNLKCIQQSDEYNSICFFDDDIKLQGLMSLD